MIAELPTLLMVPLMMNLMLYFAIGFDDKFGAFFKFYLTLILMIQAAVAMGYFVSSIFRAESTAVAFAPIFNMPITLLGGFMISLKGIQQETPQKYAAWMTYLSPVRWGFQGLMLAEYVPIATGNYAYGEQKLIETMGPEYIPEYRKNAFTQLFNYDLCSNCNDTVTENDYTVATYYDYWDLMLYLTILFLSFRVLVVLSLVIQDAQLRSLPGDTRNDNIPTSEKREKTLVTINNRGI